MNGNTLENMIKRYSDELIKMNREKALPDLMQQEAVPAVRTAKETHQAEESPARQEQVQQPEQAQETRHQEEMPPQQTDESETAAERRQTVDDIPGIREAPFYVNENENSPSFSLDEPVDFAYFSARVFTGDNAYPIENAKVLICKDDRLFTFLTTDSDGQTKRIKLPSFPESNSLDSGSNEQYVEYTGEVYAQDFTPKKDLLISAVGGSDIILDVQMTPVSERVK